MPVHNRGKYIDKAIKSILEQSFEDYEIIVIDDCSSDETVSVVQAIHDSRIKLVKNNFKTNLPILRNEGVKLAQGKYIAYMDSDDIAMPKRLEKELAFLEEHPDHGVVSCSYEVFGDQHFSVSLPTSNEDICGSLLVTCAMNNGGSLIRRSLFDRGIKHRNEFFVCDDYIFWVELIGKTKMANIDEVLVKLRFGEQQMTRQSMTNPFEKNLRKTLLQEIHKACFYQMNIPICEESINRYIYYLQNRKRFSDYNKKELEEIRDLFQLVKTNLLLTHPEYLNGFVNAFQQKFPFVL